MRIAGFALTAAVLALSANLWAQTSACDVNADGKVNVIDVQQVINMTPSVGSAPCTVNIAGSGICTSDVVNRVITSALGGSCITSHSVSLNWMASTSSNISGYNVYRSTTSGGSYAKINSAPVSGTSYIDTTVQSGQTYYYVTTAVNSSNVESGYSNQAIAAIPTP